MSRRTLAVMGGVLALVAAVVVVIAVVLSGGADVASPPATASTPPQNASTTTAAGSTAVVAMGNLADPSNTFYELFEQSSGSTSWHLMTPPGVADNGGLVVGASPTGALTAGFLPSADLTFSVLAQRAATDPSWTPGDLPGALASAPDALATGSSGQVAAVLTHPSAPASASVVGSGPGLTTWKTLVSQSELGSVSTRCAVTQITAVAVTTSGVPVVGTRCAHSTAVGLFAPSSSGTSGGGSAASATSGLEAPPSGWSRIGPTADGNSPALTTVLRLHADPVGITALVEGVGSGQTTLRALWGSDSALSSAGMVSSSPLSVPTGWSVLATSMGGGMGGGMGEGGGTGTGTGGGTGVTVLLGSNTGSARRVAVVNRSASGGPASWTFLAPPPPGSAAITTSATMTDAFVVNGARITVWSTSAGATSWTRLAQQSVPIQYGSSH